MQSETLVFNPGASPSRSRRSFGSVLKQQFNAFFCLLVSITLSGCVSMLQTQPQRKLTVQPVEVFFKSNPSFNPSMRMGITRFAGPSYFPKAGEEVSNIVHQELLRKSVFRQSLIIPRTVQSAEEAIYWGEKDGCDMVMLGSIPYLLDGSGHQTTQLILKVEIWDVLSARMLWSFEQNASSSPGTAADFYWTTVAGDPAARYKVLAKHLGEQMAELLTAQAEGIARNR